MEITVDGNQINRKIASRLQAQVAADSFPLSLAIITVGDSGPMQQFVRSKKRFGKEVGIPIEEVMLPADSSPDTVASSIDTAAAENEGVVLQLPLPSQLSARALTNRIPADADPDVLSESAYDRFLHEDGVLPPVAGAVEEILSTYDLSVQDRRCVVIGKGRLVGQPVADYLRMCGADVTAVDETENVTAALGQADVVVAGAGSPHLVTPDMISEGVWLIDCGTSEADGETHGDIHPDCQKKADLFSPVPGGVGPITVARLFQNLYTLTQK